MSTFKASVKPLQWLHADPVLDECCGPVAVTTNEGINYTVRRLHDMQLWYILGDESGLRFPTSETAKAECQARHDEKVCALLDIEGEEND